MQGHTFCFYIYRSLLIDKPPISVAIVQDIYHIRYFLLIKSEKRFEVSTFEGSLFSGYCNFREAVTVFPYFRRFAILSRGRYFRNFTVDFPRGLYLV